MKITEVNSGWRAVLSNGVMYKLVQTVFSEKRSKQLILDEYIAPLPDECQVLDVGCGPGNVLAYLPDRVNYIGFDLSQSYIDLARAKFDKRENSTFLCAPASDLLESEHLPDESVDLAVIHGVLHHVSDEVVAQMFELVRRKLKKNGKMVVLEPVWFEGQSPVRKFVMSLDRGKNIKTEKGWRELFKDLTSKWASFDSTIQQNLIRFYDIMVFTVIKK